MACTQPDVSNTFLEQTQLLFSNLFLFDDPDFDFSLFIYFFIFQLKFFLTFNFDHLETWSPMFLNFTIQNLSSPFNFWMISVHKFVNTDLVACDFWFILCEISVYWWPCYINQPLLFYLLHLWFYHHD